MEKNKLQEGLEALNRIKLLMEYDISKTSKENCNQIIKEQIKFNPKNSGPGEWVNGVWYPKDNPPPGYVWDPQRKQTRQELDTDGKIRYREYVVPGFVPLTYENINLRGVPWGFHPDEYPEYLSKVREIEKEYNRQNNYNTKLQLPSDYLGRGGEFERSEKKDPYSQKQKKLDSLKSEYYHADFPYGIKKEDYEMWSDAKKKMAKERQLKFAEAKKFSNIDSRVITPGSDYFASMRSKQKQDDYIRKVSDISKKYQTIDDYLNVIFEYDPTALAEISKSGLQKWWEKWRDLIEFVGWIVLDIASEGMATAAEARQSYLLAKILRKGMKVGLPVAIGAAITIENGGFTSESIMYFCFAVLPYAHAAFGIKEKPTVELVESIMKKMGQHDLTDPNQLKIFISTLSQSEKQIFRKVALLDSGKLKNGIEWAIKNISTKQEIEISFVNDLIEEYGLKRIKPSMLVKAGKAGVQFIGRVAADLTGIEIVNKIFSNLGLTWKEEKKQELKTYFDGLLKSKEDPQKKLLIVLNAYNFISENPDSNVSKVISSAVQKSLSDLTKSDSDITLIVLQLISNSTMDDIFDTLE